MNNNDLPNAFMLLASNAKPKSIQKSVIDKMIDDRLTRNKTRKGVKHIVGHQFKSRFLFKTTENFGLGAGIIVTPAMYRRMHIGVRDQGVPANGYPRYY